MFIPVACIRLQKLFIPVAIFILLNSATLCVNAQIGIGINPPDPSAMLHVQDTAKGLLVPRMTAAQKAAINNPAEGLMVYQTNEVKGFWYFTGGNWVAVSTSQDCC